MIYTDAFFQYQSGNYAEAIDAFRLLCTHEPLEGKFWFGLAASLQESKDYEQALQAWAVTSLLKPNDPYPHFHAAECYLSLANLADATKALDEAASRANTSLQEKITLLREQWSFL